MQKKQKIKAAFFLLKLGGLYRKGVKLASLRQHPLLFATILPISSRKKNEAGLSGFGTGCGFGPISFASLACHFVTVFFRSASPLLPLLRSALPSLGWGCGPISRCFARLLLRDFFLVSLYCYRLKMSFLNVRKMLEWLKGKFKKKSSE
nr:hypothetical protein [uncultured Bacteroides sp.]